jgi:hypothetical protein
MTLSASSRPGPCETLAPLDAGGREAAGECDLRLVTCDLSDLSHSPTLTAGTRAGVILGTAALTLGQD